MDRTLLVLLAEAWKTGEPGDIAALVDRIKEAPAEQLIETFLALRQGAQTAAALSGMFSAACRTFAEMLAAFYRQATPPADGQQDTPPP